MRTLSEVAHELAAAEALVLKIRQELQDRPLLHRTVEQWLEIFAKLPAPNSAEEAIAQRILSDMWGYRHNSQHRAGDAEGLANALIAYAKLLQEHGVQA